MEQLENNRAVALLQAQQKADELFREIEQRGLIRPNVLESQLNQDIYDLAQQMFGVSTYWHKRIVRAGRNTLAPYEENPPDLTVGEDDILFLDLGPVFEEWEADFGRTFVLGSDPLKLKLRDDIGKAFAKGKEYFESHPGVTATELYQHAHHLAKEFGWEYADRSRDI
jgi:Xaa-Pro dipeptidase